MEKTLNFTKEKVFHKLNLNEESPIFIITKFSIPKKEDATKYNENSLFTFICKQSNGNNSITQPFSPGHLKRINEVEYESFITFIQIVNNGYNYKYNEIEIFCENYMYPGFDFDICYETQPLTVSVDDPFKSFQEHITEGGNCRILFSSPYGHGKTTFLKEFFRQTVEEFDPFFIYPVNYSIARNEDIFKYIKCEILFQLLKKNVTFDYKEFSYLETLPQFIKNNPVKLLSPFLKLLPAIGGSLFEIYEKLKELGEEYFQKHDQYQIDDKKNALGFIEKVYEEEGSIFEDNFYSQLIRQLIGQLNQRGKQTVLVIDDMDRMDPEHVFRVLNVFAAHFDTPDYNEGISNKFGFKKIVFVCDINNIKKLYQHKYGIEVDFAGYIDKFFSNSIYQYDNKGAISFLIEDIRQSLPKNYLSSSFTATLFDLLMTNNLSLREILKIQKTSFSLFNKKDIGRSMNFQLYPNLNLHYFINIHYLNLIFSIEEIIQKFQNCSEQIDSIKSISRNYTLLYTYALPCLVDKIKDNNEEISYKEIKFYARSTDYENNGFYYDVNLVDDKVTFSGKDFYDILIELTKKYQLIGGLKGK